METLGEDPFRIQNYVKHLLLGLERDKSQPFKKVVASCKHYTAYNLEIWASVTRYAFNANVSMQDVVEYYLPPFQQCARDSRETVWGLGKTWLFRPIKSESISSHLMEQRKHPRSTEFSSPISRQGNAAMVLLRNDGTLPLAPKNGTKVAITGMWANAQVQMQGGYSEVPPYLRNSLYAVQQIGLQVAYIRK
jgi:beta-glucosidase-like glycosyl hydrolase